jgi:hypothetical protein
MFLPSTDLSQVINDAQVRPVLTQPVELNQQTAIGHCALL